MCKDDSKIQKGNQEDTGGAHGGEKKTERVYDARDVKIGNELNLADLFLTSNSF